jgi:PASTA domain
VAWVNAAASSSAVTSGTAGASLTGVTGGHGLVCFALYESVATSLTLTDSSGTTWRLWRSFALTGATAAVFRTTSAVVSGTHTVTASFSGGSGAWTYVIEDDQSPYWGLPVGQNLAAPGAGNTLKTGITVGVTNGSVYQLAIDTSHPTLGYLFTQNDSPIGSWCIATGINGGSIPGQSVGSSDPTGADNYTVIGMGFQPGGMQAGAGSTQVVLVKDDVGPEQRSPYPLGMFFNRGVQTIPATPLAFLSIKTPPWEFYRDPFTSVYPILQAYNQATLVIPASPYAIRWRRTNRLDPPEEDIQRFNHGVFFQMQRYYTAQLVGYHVEVPDFCDHPWLEWWHPKLDDETAMYPFRRIPVITPPGPNVIFWAQPKPWWVDEEKDPVFRQPPSLDLLLPFPRPVPQPITMPSLIGLALADAIAVIQSLNLIYLGAVFQDVIYPIPAPNRFNPVGPEPPPPYGTVIGQWPAAGTIVQPLFTEVTLIVSTGRSFISDVDTSSGNIPNTVIGSTQGP